MIYYFTQAWLTASFILLTIAAILGWPLTQEDYIQIAILTLAAGFLYIGSKEAKSNS